MYPATGLVSLGHDGDARAPVLIIGPALLGGQLQNQVSGTPVDCQAITSLPPADVAGTPYTRPSSRLGDARRVAPVAAQHRPGDARELVGERHHGNVAMRSRE
jgi:hypothetical protein